MSFDSDACQSSVARLRWVAWWLSIAIFLGNVARGFAVAGSLPRQADGGGLAPVVILAAVVDGIAIAAFVWLAADVLCHIAAGVVAMSPGKAAPPSKLVDDDLPLPAPRIPLAPLRQIRESSGLPDLPDLR